jgi:hypothetical protein
MANNAGQQEIAVLHNPDISALPLPPK